jgi:hypothetical protein
MLLPNLPWKMNWAPSEWHDDTFGLFESDNFYHAQDADAKAWITPLLSNVNVENREITGSVSRLVELLPVHSRVMTVGTLEPESRKRANWMEIRANSWLNYNTLHEV